MGIATASQAMVRRPGLAAAGSSRAICTQPAMAATSATGTAIIAIVRMSAFITDAAATASGEGATRPAKMSKVSASPRARRGASWPVACSSASPPAADWPRPASAPATAEVPVPSGPRSTSAWTSAPATTSSPICSSAAVKPRPNALPTDWKVMSAAMP